MMRNDAPTRVIRMNAALHPLLTDHPASLTEKQVAFGPACLYDRKQ